MTRKNQPIRWSLELAASEFNIDRRTLKKRLLAKSETPGSDGKYSTAQVWGAVANDYRIERVGLIAAQRRGQEMKNAEVERSLIPVEAVKRLAEGIFIAIRQRILASGMTDAEKDDLLTELSGLKTTDWARAAGPSRQLENDGRFRVAPNL